MNKKAFFLNHVDAHFAIGMFLLIAVYLVPWMIFILIPCCTISHIFLRIQEKKLGPMTALINEALMELEKEER